MSRFKILILLVTLALVGCIFGVAWWVYSRVLKRDEIVKTEIKKKTGNKRDLPDPGMRKYDAALEVLKSGGLDQGKELLYDMVLHFPDSKRSPDAKRIIGEMNMDALFSPKDNPARVDHTVLRGESLGLIARKNQTTIESIMRANGMMSSGIQPGDHLFVFPLDFELFFSISKKSLTLIKKNGHPFFKEYLALDVKLPSGVRPKPASEKPEYEVEINDKAAWFGGKRVQPTDSHFMSADKWLMGSKVGLDIRALPQAKTTSEHTVIVEPHGSKSSTASKASQPAKTPPAPHAKHSGSAKGGNSADAKAADDEVADNPVLETGIFLAREDVEELFTIIRTKTPVKIVR